MKTQIYYEALDHSFSSAWDVVDGEVTAVEYIEDSKLNDDTFPTEGWIVTETRNSAGTIISSTKEVIA